MWVLLGRSGVAKTTLISCVAGLPHPGRPRDSVERRRQSSACCAAAPDRRTARNRRRVNLQAFHLIPQFSRAQATGWWAAAPSAGGWRVRPRRQPAPDELLERFGPADGRRKTNGPAVRRPQPAGRHRPLFVARSRTDQPADRRRTKPTAHFWTPFARSKVLVVRAQSSAKP